MFPPDEEPFAAEAAGVARHLTEDESVAVAAYIAAVEAMLTEFHHLSAADARRRVIVWSNGLSPFVILHREPYMTAAALAGEAVEVTNGRIASDGERAEKIVWQTAELARVAAKMEASELEIAKERARLALKGEVRPRVHKMVSGKIAVSGKWVSYAENEPAFSFVIPALGGSGAHKVWERMDALRLEKPADVKVSVRGKPLPQRKGKEAGKGKVKISHH